MTKTREQMMMEAANAAYEEWVGENCFRTQRELMADFALEQIADTERRLAIAVEALEEALKPGIFGPQDRDGISTPEDELVMQIGKQVGFGALMDAASRMWRIVLTEKGFEGGEFVTGPCRAVRDGWVAKAEKALAQIRGEGTGVK